MFRLKRVLLGPMGQVLYVALVAKLSDSDPKRNWADQGKAWGVE